ncbi:MAG: hypothetical protein RLN81_16160 [Balneolaceae bacterium]
MDNLTPVFSVDTLTPYINLSKNGKKFTQWVIIPLPINYHVVLEDNPVVKIDEQKNEVDITIEVAGPVGKPSDEWYSAPLKIDLPSPSINQFGVDMKTTIRTFVTITDTGDVGDGEGGNSKTKYDDATEEE